jgi:pimeloyl-ACP methyl ester carboxylesterase
MDIRDYIRNTIEELQGDSLFNMKTIKFRSIDGLKLVGDYYPAEDTNCSVLLLHGITATRNEEGLYTEICKRLQSKNIASFTVDLRAHGESDGKQQELTLSGAINDIIASIGELQKLSGNKKVVLISASFSAGLCIYVAENLKSTIQTMVLFNPRLDYTPWATDHELWDKDSISDKGAKEFHSKGYIIRNDFKVGQALFNEILCFKPAVNLKNLDIPILYIHGTDDSVVPISTVEDKYNNNGKGTLIKILGADHGFTLPDDESLKNPTNIKYREQVINLALDWILKESRSSSK